MHIRPTRTYCNSIQLTVIFLWTHIGYLHTYLFIYFILLNVLNIFLKPKMGDARICDICGKSFATSSNVFRHKRKVHEVQTGRRDAEKTITCDMCQSKFTRKSYLVSSRPILKPRIVIAGDHELRSSIKLMMCELRPITGINIHYVRVRPILKITMYE